MACPPASHPETLRGQRYSMPCPTAKNWAPFVRGCAPEDAGANHDMRRVRLLDEQPVLATTGPATAHGWFCHPEPEATGPSAPFSCRSTSRPGHTVQGHTNRRPDMNPQPRPPRGVPQTAPLLYGSVCSGIEAVSLAWQPLGLEAAWFAEIEPFPSAVLAHLVRRDRAVPERRARPPLPPRAQSGRHDRDRPPGACRHCASARHPGRRHAVPVVQRCR